MRYLYNFGFSIYLIRNAKAGEEYLFYNIEKKKYACYSKAKLLTVIPLEFKEKGIDLIDFIRTKILNEKNKQINLNEILNVWIEEEITLIDYIGFKPIDKLIYEENEFIYFNTFHIPESFNLDKYKLPLPMEFEDLKFKAPHITKLLLNLHGQNVEGCKNTLLKLADRLQFPDQKAQDCIIFYPAERAGKGIFYKYILTPIFERYATKVLMKKLNSDFNAFLREALVVVLEEGKRDSELIETLKDMVTESTLLINEKGKNQKEENVYFLTFVFSNNMNPIDLGKSRGSYYICKSLGRNYEESQKVGAKLCEKIPDEIEFLIQYLHNLKFDHQDALMPFNTDAKRDVANLNKSIIELFYDEILSFNCFKKAIESLHERRYGHYEVPIFTEKKDKIYVSKDVIRQAYNNFCHLNNLRSNLISHNKDLVQLWALFNIADKKPKRLYLNNGQRLDHYSLEDFNKHIKEMKQDNKYEEEEED